MVKKIEKIKIDIYGVWDKILENKKNCQGGCGACGLKASGIEIKSKESEAGGCSCSSGNNTAKTTGELVQDLQSLLGKSDVKDNIEVNFLDLGKINVLDYDVVRTLTEEEFEPPYVIIDGMARYYGGISSALIYADIKELLQ